MFFKGLIFLFLNVLVIKWKLFKIVYYIRMRFSFFRSCQYYASQKCLTYTILLTKTIKNTIKRAIYSRSCVQNIDNWRFWIRKHKSIASFNKWTRWYWQNLFVFKGFEWTQEYQNIRILMITTQAEKEKINCVWWHDRRCYE